MKEKRGKGMFVFICILLFVFSFMAGIELTPEMIKSKKLEKYMPV